jgi:hypothetical protein|uniref:Uncharacterized protein n=1 Tax=Panagrolaimus sp. PS1159 TaxID=55785 RepID=A0AC35FHT3_9BILA
MIYLTVPRLLLNKCKSDFPIDVLKYMKANATPTMALKLMFYSKYFLHQVFPYTVVKLVRPFLGELYYYQTLNGEFHEWISSAGIPSNLWITSSIETQTKSIQNAVSYLLSKTVVCDINKLELFNQTITVKEFKFLGHVLKDFDMRLSRILKENDETLTLEDIFECLPHIEKMRIQSPLPSFSSITAAKEIYCSTLRSLYVTFSLPNDNFDIESFMEFIKKHQEIEFLINRIGKSVFPYTDVLQKFVDEMSKSGTELNISFYGQRKKSKTSTTPQPHY